MSQPDFPEAIARAEDWLRKLERQFRLTPCCPTGRDMALCSIAETMAADDRRRHLAESQVGDVKLKFFREDDEALYRRIYNNVACFFDIKRGVG